MSLGCYSSVGSQTWTGEEVASIQKQQMALKTYNDNAVNAYQLVFADVKRGISSIKDADAAYNASMHESEARCVPISVGSVTWRFVGSRMGDDVPSHDADFTWTSTVSSATADVATMSAELRQILMNAQKKAAKRAARKIARIEARFAARRAARKVARAETRITADAAAVAAFLHGLRQRASADVLAVAGLAEAITVVAAELI